MQRVLLAAAAVACALLLSPASARPAGAADGSALIAKHKAYVGWAYGDGTLKSARETIESVAPAQAPSPKPGATPDPLGDANSRSVLLRRELLYRSVTTAYGLDVDSDGFTGSVFWRANVNGNTVTRRGRDARTALTEDIIDAEALGEAPSTVRPDAAFDGKTAAVLRVDPKTGVPADLYFDRDSGALLGYVMQPEVPLERYTVHVVSYAEFAPGKRYVSAVRYGDSKRTYRVTKFDANAAVTDAELHPPAPRSSWTFGAPSTVPAAIVAEEGAYVRGGRSVRVDVMVNGHLGHFLFDSGAGNVLIFDPFAKTAGIKDIGRTSYSGVNGRRVRSTFARVDALAIGGNTLHDAIVLRGSRGFGDIDGIIGYDVLAGAIADVDLAKQTLTIADPNGFEAQVTKGAYAFPVDLSDFHAGVPMKVNGAVLPSVWLDTGDDYFVILPHELEKRTVALNATMVIAGMEFTSVVYFGGVDGGGAEPAKCVRLNEVQVGPYRYQKALSCFAPNDAFGVDGGLIGFDFLRHFNWTFDYPHGHVVLTPNGL
ncbi:MAG: hypothetical protein QOD51_3044 [Candidatus Eremiobacteraeota bacterium]|nr:hypothetical protein [Candidatus Eremiobacteraeota bacterium]